MTISYSTATNTAAHAALSALGNGIGSGIDIDSLISASTSDMRTEINNLYTKENTLYTDKTDLSSVKSLFSSLKSAIQKLTDGNITTSLDLFSAKSTTSTKQSLVTASASNSAAAQTLNVKVNNMATATVATGSTSPVSFINENTKFTDLNDRTATVGTFSIYTNSTKHELTIKDTDKLSDIVTKINTEFSDGSVKASIANGKFTLNVDSGKVSDFRLGSTSDTSTFITSLQLAKYKSDGSASTSSTDIAKVESNTSLYAVNKAGTLTDNEVNFNTPVTAGYFTIGKAEFKIDANTTLDSLIYSINQNSNAGVTASIDSSTGKMILTSKSQGESTINLVDGPYTGDDEKDDGKTKSNFLEAMGLLNSDGSITAGTQTLGKNASVEINGKNYESYSNTLTSDLTGLKGVTLTLGQMPDASDETYAADCKSTVTIAQNTSSVTSAISDFISKFNNVISTIDTDTASSGSLYGESSLTMIRNGLRNYITSSVDGLTDYACFGLVGISTGKIGASTSDNTNSLQFDQTAFAEALAKNPSAVRALFLGDSSKGITGIMQTLQKKVEAALDTQNGYFQARSDSYDSQIKSIESQITQKTNSMTAYKTQLQSQYTAMNTYITQLKSSASSLV